VIAYGPSVCSTWPSFTIAEDGPLQLSLFDDQDLAEFTHPD
jgi:hypothetical protein